MEVCLQSHLWVLTVFTTKQTQRIENLMKNRVNMIFHNQNISVHIYLFLINREAPITATVMNSVIFLISIAACDLAHSAVRSALRIPDCQINSRSCTHNR